MDGNTPINLTLAVSDVETILHGLAELPLKASLGAWSRVKQQAQTQITAAQAAGNSDQTAALAE